MLKKRICLLALGIATASQAMANDQEAAKGFVEDSHLDLFFRNGYISRDYKHGRQDKAEWGQAATATFTSGFTQGTVGVGVDAFGLYAVRLDGGKGRSGAAGIDFFKQGDSGSAADDLSKGGAAVKFRISNTVLKYGDQMPSLPVLSYDNSRLLPESYSGTLITSKEIEGLELNAGRFTAESRKSAEGRDSGGLKSINVFGGKYRLHRSLQRLAVRFRRRGRTEEAVHQPELHHPAAGRPVAELRLQRLSHQAGQRLRRPELQR